MHYIAKYKLNENSFEEIFYDERDFLKLCGKLFALEESHIEGFYHITEEGFMRKLKVSMFDYKLNICLTFPLSRKKEVEDFSKIYVYSSYGEMDDEVQSYNSMEEVSDMLEELSSIKEFKPKFALKVNFERKEYEKIDLQKELLKWF